MISFYAVMPPELVDMTIQQLNAQFPDAEIERTEGYNLFSPNGVVLGSYLTLKRESLFPIKTYRELEGDPLNALLNALAKVAKTDGRRFSLRFARQRRIGAIRVFRLCRICTKALRSKKRSKRKSIKREKKGGRFGELVLQSTPKSPDSPEPQRQMTQREQEMAKNIEDKA